MLAKKYYTGQTFSLVHRISVYKSSSKELAATPLRKNDAAV